MRLLSGHRRRAPHQHQERLRASRSDGRTPCTVPRYCVSHKQNSIKPGAITACLCVCVWLLQHVLTIHVCVNQQRVLFHMCCFPHAGAEQAPQRAVLQADTPLQACMFTTQWQQLAVPQPKLPARCVHVIIKPGGLPCTMHATCARVRRARAQQRIATTNELATGPCMSWYFPRTLWTLRSFPCRRSDNGQLL